MTVSHWNPVWKWIYLLLQKNILTKCIDIRKCEHENKHCYEFDQFLQKKDFLFISCQLLKIVVSLVSLMLQSWAHALLESAYEFHNSVMGWVLMFLIRVILKIIDAGVYMYTRAYFEKNTL